MRLRSFGLRLGMTNGRNGGNNFAAAAERKRRGVGRNDFAAPVGSCPSESEDGGGCVLFFRFSLPDRKPFQRRESVAVDDLFPSVDHAVVTRRRNALDGRRVFGAAYHTLDGEAFSVLDDVKRRYLAVLVAKLYHAYRYPFHIPIICRAADR